MGNGPMLYCPGALAVTGVAVAFAVMTTDGAEPMLKRVTFTVNSSSSQSVFTAYPANTGSQSKQPTSHSTGSMNSRSSQLPTPSAMMRMVITPPVEFTT